MTPSMMRAAIAHARAKPTVADGRPHLVLKIWRKAEPRGASRGVRVIPGAMGELLAAEPAAHGGVWIVVRAWCDDLKRALDAADPDTDRP